ncbi:MAG: hypothetical protein ACTSQO_15145 [Candidatus Helarchaeota archaeon]
MTPNASIPSTLLKDFGTAFLIILKGGSRKKMLGKWMGLVLKVIENCGGKIVEKY